MGWGEPQGPACQCEGCSRPTLNSLRSELDAERERADRMVAAFRAWLGIRGAEPVPVVHDGDLAVLFAEHAAAREAQR